ncbi:hypothetical protein THAOC_27398 [Thalassiosira oceanica]|uniref:Uncharacterized protein n=1 Tax=Thalassiosira oceanica TaxID=159749 RepID=K0RWN3_THAOC|nr:hypothetical protein THAOC_27398 [Thalassiosira oceanica]|eukprot:EJK53216.1 hypothetical protein THAOC_27398 [Thalassiosira oceanica]
MAEARNDDPFSGYDCAEGDDGDVLNNSSNEETRALLRRIKTLERSVQITGSVLAKSGISLDDMLEGEGDEDAKDSNNMRNLFGRWTDKRYSVWKFENYDLPESTFTLLITEPVLSPGFLIGVVAVGICVLSLTLVLISEWDNTSPENRFGVPAGVSKEVQVVQYLSVVIGVLMETESTVLDIFMDMLALEFVENVDDIIYELCKRGFFGKNLRIVTNQNYSYEPPGTEEKDKSGRMARFSVWCRRTIRIIYYMNMAAMLAMLLYVNLTQNVGNYRCKSLSVTFGDEVWEGALVMHDGMDPEDRLLIYSHFNGIYVEGSRINGRPSYIEMNKEDGDPFQRKDPGPAEIMYCEDIEAWVFRHSRIRTMVNVNVKENNTEEKEKVENECNWLLRSPSTDDFDIISVAEMGGWSVWKGVVGVNYPITVTCNECSSRADCCELAKPCQQIRSEMDPNTILTLAADPNDDTSEFVEVYNRPLYYAHMSGIPFGLMGGKDKDLQKYADVLGRRSLSGENLTYDDDDFFDIHLREEAFVNLMKNYTFVLGYTGQRWYGQIKPWIPLGDQSSDRFKEEGLEKDDNATLIISDPTSSETPVGVDFYELRRRNSVFAEGEYDYDYGPFGVLVPLVGYEGVGLFHCIRNGDNGGG